jgi:hypothetical protein
MYPWMSGNEDTDDETQASEGGSDRIEDPPDDATEPTEHEPDDLQSEAEHPGTDRLEEIQDELRDKENEVAEVREELEPKINEKERELNSLRKKLDKRLDDHERRLDELRDELREEITARRSPGGGAQSDRPAKAGGFILGFIGVLGFLGSVATASVGFVPDLTTPLGTEALIAVAAVSGVLSLVVLAGGWQSYKKQRWYFVVFTSLVATVFAVPLGLPALVLVAVAEPTFD